MKRFLLFLILCGSLAAQDADPYQSLLDERATLEARLKETSAQIQYHRRKALYCAGVLIELEHMARWNDPDVYDTRGRIRYHEQKEAFFRDLSRELYCELLIVNGELPIELRGIY
jgi:hypothetical protein